MEGSRSGEHRRSQPLKRSREPKAMVAGLLGFLTGIAFWHAIGFWGFVNEAVYHRNPGDVAQALPARPAFLKTQSRQTGLPQPLPLQNETCLEASPGETAAVRVSACGPGLVKFFPARGIGRADFADFGQDPVSTLINASDPVPPSGAPAVSGWSAAIAPAISKP